MLIGKILGCVAGDYVFWTCDFFIVLISRYSSGSHDWSDNDNNDNLKESYAPTMKQNKLANVLSQLILDHKTSSTHNIPDAVCMLLIDIILQHQL